MTEKIEEYGEEITQTLDFKYLRLITKGDFPLASGINLLTEEYGKRILSLDLISIQDALDYVVANKDTGEITIVLTLKEIPQVAETNYNSIKGLNKTIIEMAGK